MEKQGARNNLLWPDGTGEEGKIPRGIPVLSLISVDLVRDKTECKKWLGKLPESMDLTDLPRSHQCNMLMISFHVIH